MKLNHYIAVLCLAMMSLVSCNSTEPVTRTASSRVMFSMRSTSGIAGGVQYCGIVASRVSDGEWMTAPYSPYCTEWECAFSEGTGNGGVLEGNFYTTANRMNYQQGTYDFYVLGYNGSEPLRTAENGKLQVTAGSEGKDYILATAPGVELDGVTDKEVELHFSHLFAQVRFELILRSVDVTTDLDEMLADIELVDVSALGYRLNGEIDLNATDVKITPTDNSVLNNVVFGKKYMVIPHSDDYAAPTEATIRVKFDGKEWDVVLNGAENMTLTAGKCRVIRMTYNGVSFTTAGIPQWSIGEDIVVGDGEGIRVPQWN